ncbi:MAG: hypothetical protein DBY36_08755 [Clostridiales bacterium]|nr:MAG: hypothetical protein DBY36_08755 [Clostridiales bacterium]
MIMNNKTPDRKNAKAPAQKKGETPVTRKPAPKQPEAGSFRGRLHQFNFKLRKQRLKYGTLATVMSLLIVTAIILANVLVGFATDKYGLKFDMTSEKRFELSDETIDILKELDEKVMFHVFMTEENFRALTYGNEMAEIMLRYEVYSGGNVEVNFVDPVRNPSFVTKYSDLVEISSGSVVVEKGEKYRAYALKDLYYWYDSTQTNAVGVSIERKLTTALLYMNVEDPPKAAVLYGHSEVYSSQIATQLYEANFNVQTLNLMTDEIPDDISLLVMCCPTTDYTEDEILKLEKYFASFRDFIYITGADAPALTNLELLFREWGVGFEDAIVCDSQYRVLGDYTNVITLASTADSNLTSGFSSTKYVIAPYSKPMTQLWTESGLMTSTEILQTSPVSYAKPKNASETINSYEKEDGDLEGSFSAAIHVEYSQIVNNVTQTSNLLFLSSPYMFTADLLNSESYGNMRFMTNIMNEFNDTIVSVELKNKKFTDPELEVIGNQLTVVLVLLCVIPAVIIIMGIFVWYWRKNR